MSALCLLVDTDPALLTFGRDVDDDLALLFLLGSPEVELVGVTTTGGNTLPALAYRGAKKLLALAGRNDIRVVRGGDRPDAARFLADAVRSAPGALTLLSLGPLTNVAAASREDPGFAGGLRGLVIMGGRSRDGLSEFNFRRDPSAARAALAFSCPKVQVPLDAAFPVAITPADVARLAATSPESVVAPFARRLALFARVQNVMRALERRGPGEASGGFHPWDVVAASWLVAPDLFGEVRRIRVDVDEKGRSRVGLPGEEGFEVRMATAPDAPRFLRIFLERVARTKRVAGDGRG